MDSGCNLIYNRVIKVMVEKYPDCLQYRDDRNGTPFLTACGFGHVQLADQLITQYNADVQGMYVSISC